jgi:hypothetical protein
MARAIRNLQHPGGEIAPQTEQPWSWEELREQNLKEFQKPNPEVFFILPNGETVVCRSYDQWKKCVHSTMEDANEKKVRLKKEKIMNSGSFFYKGYMIYPRWNEETQTGMTALEVAKTDYGYDP